MIAVIVARPKDVVPKPSVPAEDRALSALTEIPMIPTIPTIPGTGTEAGKPGGEGKKGF